MGQSSSASNSPSHSSIEKSLKVNLFSLKTYFNYLYLQSYLNKQKIEEGNQESNEAKPTEPEKPKAMTLFELL